MCVGRAFLHTVCVFGGGDSCIQYVYLGGGGGGRLALLHTVSAYGNVFPNSVIGRMLSKLSVDWLVCIHHCDLANL